MKKGRKKGGRGKKESEGTLHRGWRRWNIKRGEGKAFEFVKVQSTPECKKGVNLEMRSLDPS